MDGGVFACRLGIAESVEGVVMECFRREKPNCFAIDVIKMANGRSAAMVAEAGSSWLVSCGGVRMMILMELGC